LSHQSNGRAVAEICRVDIDTAIRNGIRIFTPVVVPGIQKVEVGSQKIFVREAGRARYISRWAHDTATAGKGTTPLYPTPISADHEHVVHVRLSHVHGWHQIVRFIHQTRHEIPTGRIANNVGSLQLQNAYHLGEPGVVADEDTDPTEGKVEKRQPQVSRFKEELLLVPEVELTILPYISIRSQEDRGVVETIAVALTDPRNHMKPGALDRFKVSQTGRSIGHRFRQTERFGTRMKDVPAIAEFG